MTSILDQIASKAGASDSSWVDDVVLALQTSANAIQEPAFKEAVLSSALALQANKDDIATLGVYGLTLFVQKLGIWATRKEPTRHIAARKHPSKI